MGPPAPHPHPHPHHCTITAAVTAARERERELLHPVPDNPEGVDPARLSKRQAATARSRPPVHAPYCQPRAAGGAVLPPRPCPCAPCPPLSTTSAPTLCRCHRLRLRIRLRIRIRRRVPARCGGLHLLQAGPTGTGRAGGAGSGPERLGVMLGSPGGRMRGGGPGLGPRPRRRWGAPGSWAAGSAAR